MINSTDLFGRMKRSSSNFDFQTMGNERDDQNVYQSENDTVSNMNQKGYIKLTAKQLSNIRKQGIHYEQTKDNELVYKYSNYDYMNSDTVPTSSKVGKKLYIDTVRKIPLIGKNASNIGSKLYVRSNQFDVEHLDQFIGSETNKRMSH